MTTTPPAAFAPGTLASAVAGATARALATGALQPIPTGSAHLDDGGVRFLVRVLASLARKDEERWRREREAAAGRPVNPFLPHEPGLFVADVSPTHLALLNKYNVVDRHLLLVTRAFVDQRALLTPTSRRPSLGAGDTTRILEIPDAAFAAYRMGNTVEQSTPVLDDRPYLAREVLPYGTPATVDLLDALDRRLQRGTRGG